MPKRPAFVQGHYYHLYNRGRSRLSIFHHPNDYLDVLERMKKYLQALRLSIIAYVLLPNHYHMLVRQEGDFRSSLLPQRIFNGYSKRYNSRYKHRGTIFEADAKGILVNREDYLLHLCRYIHANPLRHGLVKSLDDWPYSNYHEWVGSRKGVLWDSNFLIENFGSSLEYQEFVDDYLGSKHEPDGFSDANIWD